MRDFFRAFERNPDVEPGAARIRFHPRVKPFLVDTPAKVPMNWEDALERNGYAKSELPLPRLKKSYSDVGVKFAREVEFEKTTSFGVKSSNDLAVISSPWTLPRTVSDLGEPLAPNTLASARARGLE